MNDLLRSLPWDVYIFGATGYFAALLVKHSADVVTRTRVAQNATCVLRLLRPKIWAVALFATLSLVSGGLLALVVIPLWLVRRNGRMCLIRRRSCMAIAATNGNFLANIAQIIIAAENKKLSDGKAISFPGMTVDLPRDFTDIYSNGSHAFLNDVFRAKIQKHIDRLKIRNDSGYLKASCRSSTSHEVVARILMDGGTDSIYNSVMCNDGNVRGALARLGSWEWMDGVNQRALAFDGHPPSPAEWNAAIGAIKTEAAEFREKIILGVAKNFSGHGVAVTESDRQKFIGGINAFLGV
ncbi:MAG: hypothetical protein LBB38_02185 [Puniceicoccales bacterium]|jgi:hypothetical protein|nr:hypothetical protein [Puniceicoccales bacterium]